MPINLTAILQVVTVAIIGIIAFFIKRELKKLEDADKENKQKIEDADKENKKKIEDVEKRLDDKLNRQDDDNKESYKEIMETLNVFKNEVGEKFVRKTDYLQTVGDMAKKLDKIYDMLFQMQEKIFKGSEKNAKSG